ncbi:MAG: hypothetical protein AUG91_07440 [Actinobacteria bacterium 13_1_20CM_4_69_9]|nr:MAG: hypothetical protein AUG91_07440 [Actinobacteria bacterium 13_1_20CM_4_69_9]
MLLSLVVALSLLVGGPVADSIELPHARSPLPVEPLAVLGQIAVGRDGVPLDIDSAHIDQRVDAELAPGRWYLAIVARDDDSPRADAWIYHLYGPEFRGFRPLLAVMPGSYADSQIETLRVVSFNGLPALVRVLAVDGSGNIRITSAVAEIGGTAARIAWLAGNGVFDLPDSSAGLIWQTVDKYGWACAPPVRFQLHLLGGPDGLLPVGYNVTPTGPIEPRIMLRDGEPLGLVSEDEALVLAAQTEPQSPATWTAPMLDEQYAINALTRELFCGGHSLAQLRAARLVRIATPRDWSYDALVVTRDEASKQPIVWTRIALGW